jgi:hypothetical protein
MIQADASECVVSDCLTGERLRQVRWCCQPGLGRRGDERKARRLSNSPAAMTGERARFRDCEDKALSGRFGTPSKETVQLGTFGKGARAAPWRKLWLEPFLEICTKAVAAKSWQITFFRGGSRNSGETAGRLWY